MRTRVLLIVMLLCMLPTAFAAVSSTPRLTATLLYYEPVPATPGSIINVYVQVQNNGTAAENIAVEFIDNHPFSIDNSNDRIKSIDTIPGQSNFLVKYQVRVSEDAQPGTNYLKIQYGTSGRSSVQSVLLPIDVSGTAVSLDISDVTIRPETFVPGDVGLISITVRNGAQLRIIRGSIKLDLTAIDLAPIGSTNQQRLTQIDPGQSTKFDFRLAAPANMTPGVYKLPVQMTFTDQQNREYNVTEYIGVRVGAEPDLLVYVDQSTILDDTMEGELVLKFVNKGYSEIKYLDFEVLPSEGVEMVSESKRIYVGNIDEDDYETSDLTVKLSQESAQIPIKISYRDSLNRQYTQEVSIPVASKPSASGAGSSPLVWVLIVIVLVVAGIWAYRRWNRKK